MIIDKLIEIKASSKIIFKLKSIGIFLKQNEIILLPIDKLWKNSNYKINVKCDLCEIKKTIAFSMYNKNIKKHGIYCCGNKCSSIKNKLTNLEKYGDKNYNNPEKRMETNLEKYGDKNYNNPEKRMETNLEKYGTNCVLKLDKIKDKIKKTNLEKYGVEDSRSSIFVKNKRMETNLKKYGAKNYTETIEYKEKVIKNSLLKYGVSSPNKVDEIKFKKIKSMIKKYGFISNSISDESKEKLKNTNLEKYGVEYPMQVMEFAEKQQRNAKKIKYYNETLYYQGTYEKDFLDHVSKIGIIEFVTRGPYIKYKFDNKIKAHYPDYYIQKYNLIVEVKSSYYYNKFIDKNKAKMDKCIHDGYNYLFIINKNYRIFDEIVKITL